MAVFLPIMTSENEAHWLELDGATGFDLNRDAKLHEVAQHDEAKFKALLLTLHI